MRYRGNQVSTLYRTWKRSYSIIRTVCTGISFDGCLNDDGIFGQHKDRSLPYRSRLSIFDKEVVCKLHLPYTVAREIIPTLIRASLRIYRACMCVLYEISWNFIQDRRYTSSINKLVNFILRITLYFILYLHGKEIWKRAYKLQDI